MLTSFVRTYIPLVAGLFATWLISTPLGADIDSAQVAGSVVALLSALWYAAVRYAEKRWPQAGWLLGSPHTPSYDTAKPLDSSA